MTISGTEVAKAQNVTVSDEALVVDLADGRTITVPVAWFPRLAHGTAGERAMGHRNEPANPQSSGNVARIAR